MLTGAGLSRAWPHDRAHCFFSRARWNPDDLGIAAAMLVVALLVPGGDPVEVLIDDTLFRRRGKRVWAASWFHDGAAQGPAKTGYGNNWVVLAVRVRLPMISRPVAIPVMAKLVVKGTNSASRLWLARRMVTRLAAELPGREINVTADSACAGEELRQLPDGVTWTTRLRANAALHDLPPGRTGKKGRPRKKGDRLPSLAKFAAAAAFSQVTVTRYGKAEAIAVHAFTCLWYSVTGPAPVTVILIRDKSKTGYDIALVTTEKNPDIVRVVERYAARWAIEVAIEDAKQLFGTGQARNRTAAAVERTIPFMLACQAIAVCWYATAGHHPADAGTRRLDAPWYTSKAEPSTADMTANSAASSSPPDLSEFPLTSQNPQKSMLSAWPGKTPQISSPKPRKSSDTRHTQKCVICCAVRLPPSTTAACCDLARRGCVIRGSRGSSLGRCWM